MHKLATKPHIKLTGKAVWQCADAHLARSGRSWKQAYDRWLMASLRDASTVANLCAPKESASKKPAKPKEAELAELAKSSSLVSAPLLRQPGSAVLKKAGKPITIKAQPKVALIEQPAYHASIVSQLPGSTGRPEYRPPADLLRNMERAGTVQRPLISISTSDRSTS